MLRLNQSQVDKMVWHVLQCKKMSAPLSGVCVSLPSARPPLALRSLLQTCSASPDPRVGSPGNKIKKVILK